MSISIADYEFDGPYTTTTELKDRGGVYTILAQDAGKYRLLDVGESATVKSRVEHHDRTQCWQRHANGRKVRYAAYYTPNLGLSQRVAIEHAIRERYDPPCGER